MYIFNLNYKLRQDDNRLVLIDDYRRGGGDFKSFIHPVYAWIIDLFDGLRTLDDVLDSVCDGLNINRQQAQSVVTPLIDKDSSLYIKYDGVVSVLPPHVITEESHGRTRTSHADSFFSLTARPDHSSQRLNRPMTLLLCPSLHCYTDCIYCYAERKHPHKEFDASFWVKFIYHAHEQGIERIDVTGGEFFLKKGWQLMARALVDCGYMPEISTKVPLSEQTLDDIKESGLGCVQFSLDTLDAEVAKTTLKVDDRYVERLRRSITYADSIGLSVILKPTLTRMTCNEQNVRSIIRFADTLHHVRRITVSTIGFSCYKPRTLFADIRPSIAQVNALRSLIDNLHRECSYPVIDDTFTYRPSDLQNKDVFDDRATCTANLDGFVVLPDGTATICEELYWHPAFIIGNCHDASIPEVWHSDRAVNLFYMRNIPFPAVGSCAACNKLTDCRTNKGVCWKLVLAAYGMDKPYYPDPRCPQAPDTDGAFLIP